MTDCGTILVVDHDDLTRKGASEAARRLGYDVLLACSGHELLETLGGMDRPALAIVDVELDGHLSGLELLRELHERFGEDFPVILVAAARTAALDRVAGLLLGADDYVAKPIDVGELSARIRRSLRRAGVQAGNGNGNGPHRPDVDLSRREREILGLMAEGMTQKQIATLLVISPKTVATHIQHLLSKLGVHSRAQAVAIAFQLGLVEPEVRAHRLIEPTLDRAVFFAEAPD